MLFGDKRAQALEQGANSVSGRNWSTSPAAAPLPTIVMQSSYPRSRKCRDWYRAQLQRTASELVERAQSLDKIFIVCGVRFIPLNMQQVIGMYTNRNLCSQAG